MSAGHWNNEHLFAIGRWFQQTFAIWLFVVNFNFSLLISSSWGQPFFKCRHSTKPLTLYATLANEFKNLYIAL
jgi:hypothetical protein